MMVDQEIYEPEVEEINYSTDSFYEINESGNVTLNDSLFIEFLENSGFHTVRLDNDIKLIQIQGNIIKSIITDDVKRFLLNYADQYYDRKLKDFFIRNTVFFNQRYLSALSEVHPQVIRDTENSAYFFFRNGVVQVTKEGLGEPIPYDEFGHLVWEQHINDREFKGNKLSGDESVFYSFITRLANNNPDRIKYLCSVIGYALHNYRTSDNTKAIVINDENISDQPEGGSGKSLLAKSLGYLRKQVMKDGKTFNPKRSFEYSDVDETTDLLLIDETPENFAFVELFSVILDGITIEKKYANKRRLPVEHSPLFIITTNKVIRGYGGSYKRRQHNVDIYQHFNHQHTPKDEFGHTFFTDWDEDEWLRFDTFMLLCVKLYITEKIAELPEEFNREKDAIRATNETFFEWFEEVKYEFQNHTSTSEAARRYQEETGDRLSSKKFRQNIKKCCEIFGYKFTDERTSQSRGFWIQIE